MNGMRAQTGAGPCPYRSRGGRDQGWLLGDPGHPSLRLSLEQAQRQLRSKPLPERLSDPLKTMTRMRLFPCFMNVGVEARLGMWSTTPVREHRSTRGTPLGRSTPCCLALPPGGRSNGYA